MSEILTIPQAAEYLQVRHKTIRRLISNKKLSASKKVVHGESKKVI